MKGILYGIGTGPGDPELMTLKAVRVISECGVIAVPASDIDDCIAWRAAAGACPGIEEKEILRVPFLMGGAAEEERAARRIENADKIAAFLDQGRDVAFLTIGDPTIYTTFGYAADILKGRGYEIVFVSGMPSFCGVSARLGTMLCSGSESLEIIPGVKKTSGVTRVYMKTEKNLPALLERLRSEEADAKIVENCCLEDERVFEDISDLPDDIGYFNIIVAKEKTNS